MSLLHTKWIGKLQPERWWLFNVG